MHASLSAACLAAAILAPASAFEQTDYPINLDRPAEPGTTWEVRADGRLDDRAVSIIGGERSEVETRDTTVRLHAIADVLEADDAGRAKSVNYTILELALTTGGRTSTMAEEGSRLSARRFGDRTLFEIDGLAPAAEWLDALELVAGLGAAPVLTDAVFGTPVVRGVGESWPIDGGSLSHVPGFSMLSGAVGEMSGETTLSEVRRRDDMTCLLIEGTLDASGTPVVASTPPGFTADEAQCTIAVKGLLPVDVTLPALEETQRLHAQIVLRGMPQTPQEGTAVLIITNRTLHRTRSRVTGVGVATGADDRPQ